MRGEHGHTKITSTEAKGFAGPSGFAYYLSSRLPLRGKVEGRLKTGQRVLIRVMPQRVLRSACYLMLRRNLAGSPSKTRRNHQRAPYGQKGRYCRKSPVDEFGEC